MWKAANRACLLLFALFILPIGVSAAVLQRDGDTWYTARRDPTGMAPEPADHPKAVLQVYAARTFGWRGAFSVHTWISMKPKDAAAYERYEVMGWGVDRGTPAIRVNRMGPDNYWFGSRPELLLDKRGPEAQALIASVKAAVRTYPYPNYYRTWPGPNSNTFLAHIARSVPELALELPPNAVGKDFLPEGTLFAPSPSGSGYQLSVYGVAGLMLAIEEGVEINLFGLSFGVDLNNPALKLPGLGRIGF